MRYKAFLLFLVSGFYLNGISSEQEASQSEGEHTIRAVVEMVSLPVVVTTKTGKRITDLTKEDFQVFENGVEQEIAGFSGTDEPLAIALLLDTSGSTEQDLAKIQNAAITFTHQLHPDDEVAVLSFADDVKLQSNFSIDRNKNEYGIKKTRTGEWTAVYEAVWLALEDVLKPKVERKALVIFSDGVDTCSHKASRGETIDLSKETKATIYGVFYDTSVVLYKNRGITTGRIPGINWPQISTFPGSSGSATSSTSPEDTAQGKAYLSELAQNSGGLVFDGENDLRYAFEQVAKELACQYNIGYYPTNLKKDGKFRKVEVKMKKPGLVARTKKGYVMHKESAENR
jgi:Ca-activated chloride channel homolog